MSRRTVRIERLVMQRRRKVGDAEPIEASRAAVAPHRASQLRRVESRKAAARGRGAHGVI